MLALISPAKSMEIPMVSPKLNYTQPIFKEEIKAIVTAAKKLKHGQLMKMLSISEKLAELNVNRYKNFTDDFTLENGATPAITSFAGDVYLGLDAKSFGHKEMEIANQKILILSGLYGLIRPLDLILPYRLEMGTTIKVEKAKNLYEFWGSKIASEIEKILDSRNATFIINLASDEYFKAVRPYLNAKKLININFKEEKNGKWTFISFNAKKARGLMCRYIVNTKAKNPENLKAFDYEDYIYNEALSSDHEWVFTRKFIPINEKRAKLL